LLFSLCCQCGVLIDPNALNMCHGCMQTQIDITEQIPKQGQLQMCNKCIRYLQPPNTWISAQLESRELLTVCLKRIKGLNKEVDRAKILFSLIYSHLFL